MGATPYYLCWQSLDVHACYRYLSVRRSLRWFLIMKYGRESGTHITEGLLGRTSALLCRRTGGPLPHLADTANRQSRDRRMQSKPQLCLALNWIYWTRLTSVYKTQVIPPNVSDFQNDSAVHNDNGNRDRVTKQMSAVQAAVIG